MNIKLGSLNSSTQDSANSIQHPNLEIGEAKPKVEKIGPRRVGDVAQFIYVQEPEGEFYTVFCWPLRAETCPINLFFLQKHMWRLKAAFVSFCVAFGRGP